MKKLLILSLLIISCVITGTAQIQTASAQNPYAKQIERTKFSPGFLEYFVGDWSGVGKFSNDKDLTSEFNFTTNLENQCLVVRHEELPPHDFQFIALLSKDSATGNLVMLVTSNKNSGARLFRSDAGDWKDEKIVFQSTPELRSAFALERFTFERQSASSFKTTYEMSRDEGKTWRIGDKQVFTKK